LVSLDGICAVADGVDGVLIELLAFAGEPFLSTSILLGDPKRNADSLITKASRVSKDLFRVEVNVTPWLVTNLTVNC
jgi:hypothetical protein